MLSDKPGGEVQCLWCEVLDVINSLSTALNKILSQGLIPFAEISGKGKCTNADEKRNGRRIDD